MLTYCSTTFYIILMIFKIGQLEIFENHKTEIDIGIFVQMQICYVIRNSTCLDKLTKYNITIHKICSPIMHKSWILKLQVES